MPNEDTINVDGGSGGKDSGIHWGGGGNGGGNGSNSSGANLSSTPEAQKPAAYGVPAVIGVYDGMWGFTLFTKTTLQEAMQAALTRIEQGAVAAVPLAGRLLGATIGALIPSEIAKDDPRMMATAHLVNSLPFDKVSTTPPSALPTQKATVVHTRIADVVDEDGKQHIAVVKSKNMPMSVPVVDAKPTKRPGVYTAGVVPGKPDLHVKVDAGKAPAVSQSQPKGIQKEQGASRYPGFTTGQNTHEAIVRFPDGKSPPIYVSVTEVSTPDQVKKRLEEEKRRTLAWALNSPVEAAAKEDKEAGDQLSRAQADIVKAQERLNKALQAIPQRNSDLDAANKGVEAMLKWVKQVEVYAHDPDHPGHRVFLQAGYKLGLAKEKAKVSKAALDAAIKEKADAEKALAIAVESRKQKEQKKKASEQKLADEKKKPHKGAKDYGHDYHPVPKTEEIKGLGDLTKGAPKTPKQNGGGKRPRWYGDKKSKIYEWDSQHGELEGYRGSDGSHLGAFDPATGKQVKGPDPKRNIKKYL